MKMRENGRRAAGMQSWENQMWRPAGAAVAAIALAACGAPAAEQDSAQTVQEACSHSHRHDRIVFVHGSQIRSAHSDGTGDAAVGDSATVWGPNPSLSPDGSKIAYVKDTCMKLGGGCTPQEMLPKIWIMSYDGTQDHRVTGGNTGEQFPSWSADGNRLVFTSGEGDNCYGIGASINIASAIAPSPTSAVSWTQVTQFHPPCYFVPKLSPDGNHVVFQYDWEFAAVVRVDAHLTLQKEGDPTWSVLASSGWWDGHPDYSDDGSKIVFTKAYGDVANLQLFVMNSDGSGATPVAATPWNDDYADVRGNRILFQSDRSWPCHGTTCNPNHRTNIWSMNTSGGEVKRVTGYKTSDAWSPSW